MDSTFANCINANVKILERNDVNGAKETIQKLKEFLQLKPVKTVLDALQIHNENYDSSLLVFGHG